MSFLGEKQDTLSDDLYRIEEAEYHLKQALALLKRAGDALNIEQSQKVRALRFQILQFLENSK